MFRLVTFDVVGTLLHFSINPSKVYTNSAKKFGVRVQEELVDCNFRIKFKEMTKTHPNFGRATGISWETWWHNLVVDVLRASASCDQQDEVKFSHVANDLIAIYRSKDCYMLADGVEDILTALKPTGVKIGIITNFDERIHSVLLNVGLNCYFDFVVASFEAGAEKPSPEIFKKAMKSACHEGMGKDCLHIGDEIERDYLGARSAGWNAALITNNDEKLLQTARRKGVSASDIFPSMSELKPYLLSNVCRQ